MEAYRYYNGPNYSDTASVYVLSVQFFERAKDMLRAARESGCRLETAYDLLKEQFIGLAVRTQKGNLVEGHNYGYLTVSPDATAERGGRMIPHHGEIYIGIGMYQRRPHSHGELICNTAWGAEDILQIPEGMLLLDLP